MEESDKVLEVAQVLCLAKSTQPWHKLDEYVKQVRMDQARELLKRYNFSPKGE